MLQKFWYNVFTGTFNQGFGIITSDPTGNLDYNHYLSGTKAYTTFFDMRMSLLNAISQLVVFYGVYQKLNVAQTFLFSVMFQVFWTLNFHLNAQLVANQPDDTKRLFDDYTINQVFLFGAVFGLVVSFINKKPPREDYALGVGLPRHMLRYPGSRGSEVPLIVSLIGTFLLFITFMSISIFFPIKSVRSRYIWS